ncbi:DUF885 domain-containing protein [Rhodococcus sp. NPDC058505]|uniref:DUF885 domain-containing protein n=1 Tax=unclassified Rhodococcus (in: high G+C Gram-positive bacteria) TaxID=192944 RepID=UPI003658FF6F
MDAAAFVREYLLLGLGFDRIEEGFVDAYTGDPALRRQVENAPAPEPRDLARRAAQLRAELRSVELPADRAEFLDVHLRALECSARTFAGERIGFVDEVHAYFDVRIEEGNVDDYRDAHRAMDEVLAGGGTLAERLQAHRAADEIPPERLAECVDAFSSALRDLVRARYPLPETERVEYEVVGDKPWSGFNYYLGDYRSKVAINSDLKQHMANLPHLIAHEAYPGHHTEHCRKEAGLVDAGQVEHTLFLVNTPQCLMAEGLADHALGAIVGDRSGAGGATRGDRSGAGGATRGQGWGRWAEQIYADLGLRFDGERAEALSTASAKLLGVRQDAALLLHDRGRSHDEVARFLQTWNLSTPERARQSLRFLSSPLWRAYTSTYVEGYRLLGGWLDRAVDADDRADRFGRLLDEPLIPSALR